ncbi:acyltransferase family protein [Noviherbaspirillum pedocola]|uniref:Acyltransferase n=1 Tax=Noviherbaspirillum pedocola TaxID=2801341 RepID=A0A934W978_9BURK|nr:acyltransferase [Noviherbaspirillum pedocola]MBK4736704.1 acyltransferase [Noviherbaspirillum pedocola]
MGLLRLLLAFAVFFQHAMSSGGFSWISGIAAVYVFFVISGFYIQMVLATRYTPEQLGPAWWRMFHVARYCRLYPAYAAACLIAIAVQALFSLQEPSIASSPDALAPPTDARSSAGIGMAFGLTLSQLTMIGLNIPSSSQLLVGPAWSLGVELSFYLLAPWLLRLSDRKLIALMAFGLLLRLVPYNTHAPLMAASECFLAGALAWRWRGALDWTARWPRKLARPAAYALAMMLPMLALSHQPIFPIPYTHIEIDTLVAPFLAALVIPAMYRATHDLRVDRLLGELSYPFYLFHEPLLRLLGLVPHGPSPMTDNALTGAAFLVALLLSALMLALEMRLISPWRTALSKPRVADIVHAGPIRTSAPGGTPASMTSASGSSV